MRISSPFSSDDIPQYLNTVHNACNVFADLSESSIDACSRKTMHCLTILVMHVAVDSSIEASLGSASASFCRTSNAEKTPIESGEPMNETMILAA